MKMLGISLLLLASNAFANNPLIRICNVTGGVFHEIQTSDDHIGMCQYGSAFLDSMSVLDVTSNNQKSTAVEALETLAGKTCQEVSGKTVDAFDLENNSFHLCLFEDGSVIEAQTLRAGGGAGSNLGLMKAIRTRF